MTDSIKNQFNNSTFNNPTFNFDSKDDTTQKELDKRSLLLSYEIQDIYKHMNYQIEDRLELGEAFFIAEQSIMGGMEKIRILVKCLFKNKNINVSKSEIQIFDSEFNTNKNEINIDKGFLVTNTDFDKKTLSNINVKCITQDELSKGILYVKDSLKAFIKDYEKEEIYQRYIDLTGKIKEINHNIVEYLLKEIHKENALYTIFGDFGTGKSTILNKMCYEVSKMYLSDKSTKIPLLIELKDFYNNKDILSFVYNAFHKQYHSIEVLPEIIMNEIKEGKFLLLLDGFDEMSAQISIESRFENFNKLSDLLKSKSKCILTCRSSYFITHEEYKNNIPKLLSRFGTFQGRVDELGKKLDDKYIHKGTLDYNGQSQIITNNVEISINPLIESQIKTYFEKCANEFREKCNSNIEGIYNFILSIYDLGDLITKPILLSIITDTILLEGKNYLKSDIKYGHSALYEKYTELILKRDWGKGEIRHYLSMEQRNRFAEAIAITMLYKEMLEVKYDDILHVIDTHKDILSEFKENISNSQTQEFIASDIRVCSFLKRTDENTFKFVHKSFMEFFVAQFIATQLMSQESSNILSEKILNKEILFFIGGFGVYKSDIQKKIYSVWRKNYKTKNQILKRNLCCAFILSKIEHNNNFKNTFNVSDVNIESISIRKIKFRNVEYNKVNFIDTDFADVNIADSKFRNIQIEAVKFNKVNANNTIFQFTKLNNGHIENCSLKLKEIKDFECKELISINTDYNFTASKLNVYDSEYQKCIIKFELTDSNFKSCSFKACPDVYFSGKNNAFESVQINNTENLIFQGFFTLKGSRITNSTIEINDTIIFSDCEFKNCKFVGNGRKNYGQFGNCKFEDCFFVDFYIEYAYLFYQEKEKMRREEIDYLDKQKKIERESLIFNNCTGIILTDTKFTHTISSTLLVFNVENYQIEISNCIKQKENSIRRWKNEETKRKEKLKEDINKIRNDILIKNSIKNKDSIDTETQKEIDIAIKEYKNKNARVITENFNEKRENELVMFLKQYCDNKDDNKLKSN
jgi:uncharacterized protein YjbI with pentapeptide repeats